MGPSSQRCLISSHCWPTGCTGFVAQQFSVLRPSGLLIRKIILNDMCMVGIDKKKLHAAAMWRIQNGEHMGHTEHMKFCMFHFVGLLVPSQAWETSLSVQVLEPSAWATMLAVLWLHDNGKELKEEWELLERKAVVWLHKNAGRNTNTVPTPFPSPLG